MSSGTDIIEEALQGIGAHSLVAPAPPDAISTTKDVLNSMLQLWLSLGIDLGITPLDAPGDELSEPLDARQGIIDNLSIMAAPKFDNGKVVVSQTLRDNARRNYEHIKLLYQVFTIPDKVISSTTPLGQGHRVLRSRRRIYAGEGATIKSTKG